LHAPVRHTACISARDVTCSGGSDRCA